MENAVKALTIAGEVIVGVMILAIIVAFFNRGNKLNSEYDGQMTALELERFNNKFEAYNRENLTYDDIISVANMAYDNNKKCNFDETTSVEIEFNCVNKKKYKILYNQPTEPGFFWNTSDNRKENFYDNNFAEWNTSGIKYVCSECRYSNVTGKIEYMLFNGICEHVWLKNICQPTCMEKGYTHWECSKCGEGQRDTDFKDTINHTFVAYQEYILGKAGTFERTGIALLDDIIGTLEWIGEKAEYLLGTLKITYYRCSNELRNGEICNYRGTNRYEYNNEFINDIGEWYDNLKRL